MIGGTLQSRATISFLLGFLLLYSFVALYLSHRCFRDPSSIFFRPEHARVLSYSAFRKAQANKFASQQAALQQPVKWAGGGSTPTPPQLCVAIGSVSRHGFSYLKETLGSVLEGLDERERKQIYVVVFLAHSNQSQHEDFGQPWLQNMADSLPTYNERNATLMGLVKDLEIANDYPAHARKQKIDFSVLLGECARVNPAYTMTLEDDVIAVDGWYHRVVDALKIAVVKTQEMGRESCEFDPTYHRMMALGRTC